MKLFAAVPALVALLLALGCGSTVPTSTPTVTPAPTPTVIFGRIVVLTPLQVTIQDGEFLEGDEADAAAVADGTHAYNNFYIRWLTTTRLLAVDPACSVQVTGYDAEGDIAYIPYDVSRLVAALANIDDAHLYSRDYFWLTLRGDTVVRLVAQETP
jgi:hypothetical protein